MKIKGHACIQVWFGKDGCWWMCTWSMGRRACVGEGVNETVCSQVSAVMSDVWRTYRLVMYAKARVVFPVSAVSSIMADFCKVSHQQ